MPEILFKVLCANDSDACDRVKSIMKDFVIDPNAKGRDFDYIGVKNFDCFLDARQRAKEIHWGAGIDLIDIKLRLNERGRITNA